MMKKGDLVKCISYCWVIYPIVPKLGGSYIISEEPNDDGWFKVTRHKERENVAFFAKDFEVFGDDYFYEDPK